ncbi:MULTISPECIES: ABC transporter substrate-binding protein [Salinibaculum]|uniref:ABC transporter substrate-binding protein n=1 Tax=Salinibaculum TaxID=2732368 RepID=UPI0030D08228
MSQNSESDSFLDVSRRKVLGGAAGLTALSLSGCSGLFGDGGDGDGGTDLDPVRDRVTVDPADVQEGGTLKFGLGAGIDSFDPAYSTSAPATNAFGLIYETIIRQDAAGEVYPWLAKSWSREEVNDISRDAYSDYMVDAETTDSGALTADSQILIRDQENQQVLTVNEAPDAVEDGTYGMRYRAELQEGVTFHNGEEMTAENVIGGYRVYENSDNAAQTFDSFLYAEKIDDYTVDIYAQVPDAEAASQLPVEVYPTEHIENYPDTPKDPRQDLTPIGTGPMKFESFSTQESVSYSKFDNYWLEDLGLDALEWWDGPEDFPAGPVVDAVEIRIVQDDATRAAALNNNEIDITYGLASDTYSDYRESENYRLSVTNAGAYNFLQFPVTVEPWDNAKLRRGINQLIPREAIANNVYNGYRNPAYTPLPRMASKSGTEDYEALLDELKPKTQQDTEAAVEIIQEAIDENDIETPIEATIETNTADDRVREVELISQALNQAGDGSLFETNVETFEFNTLIQRIFGPDYYKQGKLTFIGLSGTFNPGSFYDAVNSVDNFRQCCNFQRVDTPDLNEIADDARFSVDAVESEDYRGQQYDKVWDGLVKQSPNIYTVFGTNVACLTTDYKGHNTYTFSSSILPYGLHAPQDEQVAYLDR